MRVSQKSPCCEKKSFCRIRFTVFDPDQFWLKKCTGTVHFISPWKLSSVLRIRDPVPFWPLNQEFVIVFLLILDPTNISESSKTIFGLNILIKREGENKMWILFNMKTHGQCCGSVSRWCGSGSGFSLWCESGSGSGSYCQLGMWKKSFRFWLITRHKWVEIFNFLIF